MPATPDGLVEYESGQTTFPLEALTTSDNITFSSTGSLWSSKAGFKPDIRPDGVRTGAVMTPTATNDEVSYTSFTAYVNGVDLSVSGGTSTITRASIDTYIVNSLVVDNTGTVAFVQGAEGTSFSETRGANGGPALIAVDSIELGQVRTSVQAAGAIAATGEIFQAPDTHQERSLQPVFTEMTADAGITFVSALKNIHVGVVPKTVYASFAEPIFAEISDSVDFVMPENTAAVNSTQVYGRTVSSASLSLGQGSFTALLQNGITDPILTEVGETLWFRFRPDRLETPNHIVQAVMTLTRGFPADDQRSAAFTLTALSEGQDKGTL